MLDDDTAPCTAGEALKERPIPFSDAMVRAILDGTKTQTRRLVRPPTGFERIDRVYPIGGGWRIDESNPYGIARQVTCPYGVPGDRLWVRETWNKEGGSLSYRADGDWIADYRAAAESGSGVPRRPDLKWRPSIFLPRWASRITLELTDVRAERLQDITDEDARAEGCDAGENMREGSCRDLFSVLWDSINAERALWVGNPWVWALTFKRVKP
jgi:hypothetical protein